MQIATQNHNDPAYERLLNDLIREVFGFRFAPWYALGLWDARYESYAVIEKGKMLANVCVFHTDLRVAGQPVRALQFGAVATRKKHRGRGLSRALMEYITAQYPQTPAFLFANESVTDFYPRFGFRRVPTHRPVLRQSLHNPGKTPIRLQQDSPALLDALARRGQLSRVLDCGNTDPIRRFHLLMDYADSIYLLPECGAVAVAEQSGETLFLADVIAAQPVTFAQLAKELPFCDVSRVEFGFTPDFLGVEPEWEADDEILFLRGDWQWPERCCFPAISMT